MAIRTVAQAAADIRLSDTKANADFEKIRRELIAKATRLEQDMALKVPVTIDQAALRNVAARVQQGIPAIVVPVTLDQTSLAEQLAGLASADVPAVVVPVIANTDEALGDLVALTELGGAIDIPVRITTEGALNSLTGLGTGFAGITVPVRASTQEVTQAITQVSRLAEGPFTVKFVGDVGDVKSKISAVGSEFPEGVKVPIIADNSEAIASVRAVGDSAQPVSVAVLADVSTIAPTVAKVDLPPLHVPVTAADVGPGIAKSPGLARIRAELDNLEANPPHINPVVDTTQAVKQITAVSTLDYPPAVLPVVADTTAVPGQVAAVTDNAQPIHVPVAVDTTVADQQIQTFGSSLGQQIEPGATQGGRVAGQAFGRELLSTANRVLSVGALAVGGLLASSLVEGFQRFTTIQDSTASLTVALNSAAKAGALLGDVLNVVRGTPFRLDDFARAATNMVSFGIAAQKVPLYLTAIGEAAATRGSQANQFAQSLATIFGQVQAIGKINGEDIWQFGNVGVDALRILGNTVGKTTAEIRKMISEGAIPAGFALDALAQGILHGTEGVNGATVAFSGVMEKLGDTLSGSIENFGAAKARFGVAIIDPISKTLVHGFQSFTKVIDDFTARTKTAFTGLEQSPVFEAINEFFTNAPSLIEPTLHALEDLGPALAPLTIAFGALGLGALSAALGPLGALIPGVTGLGGAFAVAATSAALLTPEIRDALIPALQDLGEIGGEVGGTVVRGLGEALEGVTPVVVRAFGVLRGLAPDISTFFTTSLGAIGGLGPKITPILNDLVTFAEQALPVAFRAAGQGVVALTGVVDAALPVVDQLIKAATDLVPTFNALVSATAAIGTIAIPVLQAFGDVIGEIPVGVLQTLLGVFLGFKAISFFQTQITGISTSLGGFRSSLRSSVSDFQEFRAAGQGSFTALRSELANLTKSGSAAQSFGLAVSGAFSGMALESENAATRITGAVGAIGSVLGGLATGGIQGGVIAAAGVGIGLIAQHFIDAKRESDAFKASVDELAKSLEGLSNPETTEALGKRLQDDLIKALGDIDIKDLPFLQNFDLAAIVTERLNTGTVSIQNVIDQIFGNLKINPSAIDGLFAQVTANAEQFGVDLKDVVDDFDGSLERLQIQRNVRASTLGIDPAARAENQAALDQLDAFIATIESIQSQFKSAGIDGDALATIIETITDKTSGFNKAVAERDLAGTWKTTTDAVDETAGAVTNAGDQAADALAKWKQALLDDGITMEELRAQAEDLGNAAVTSADKASAAFERFGSVLDSIKSKLDLRIQTQNLDKDFADLSKSLTSIINTEDLKKAEGIGDDITAVEKRIAELKGKLAEENARGDLLRVDLQRRIAKAESIGAVNAAATLRTQLEETFFGARDIQSDIDAQFNKIAELRGKLSELSAVPQTLLQKLTAQAAEANLSFFDFLLAAPTPEAQSFFQDQIGGSVSDALSHAADVAAKEGPIQGALAAESFLAPFRQSLIDGGIDASTVDKLIAEVWPADKIKLSSEEAAQAAADAFFAEVDSINNAPPGTTVDLPAKITDLDKQQTEIENFLKNHPDIKLPIGLDITTMENDLGVLRERNAQQIIDDRLAAVKEAEKVQLLEGFGGPAAVARAFPTAQELAEDAVQTIKDQVDQLNASDENVIDLKPKIDNIDSEIADLNTILQDPKNHVVLAAEFDPDALKAAFEEAVRKATAESALPSIFNASRPVAPPPPPPANNFGQPPPPPGFHWVLRRGHPVLVPLDVNFADGGIHGFVIDAPHTAQIAHGSRTWAEPETGGEAYLPLAKGKRKSALGVFMQVADIFDLDVQPRSKSNLPDPGFPELTHMFQAVDARTVDTQTVRNAVIDAMHAIRRPATQEDLERNVIIERIEQLTIGPGETPRKRASEFVREMRLRAARI